MVHTPLAPVYEYDCIVCGAHTVGTARSRTGIKCAKHRHYKRTNCATCDQVHYNANRNKPGHRAYCSPQCKPQPRSEHPAPSTKLEWKQCICGQWICRPRKKYCDSKACKYEGWAHASGRRDRKCRQCGAAAGKGRQFCDACRRSRQREAASRERRERRRKYGKSFRSKARHFGVEYELVNRQSVYARDGWRCGICRKKVDKRLKAPHPMSASLDHIVPMSLGGGHTYINTQCAHHRCNSLKSNREAGDQLALVG